MSEILEKSKAPMWKRTMLQNLSLSDITNNLYEISDAGDYFGYDDSDRGQYYEEYRELFNELSFGAQELCESIERISESGKDIETGWDDATVALIGPVCKVLGYDSNELDYFDVLNGNEQNWGVEEAEKRLLRLTKAQLIHLFRKVMVTLVAYMDIKGSFDTLSAVVNELDDRAAAMKDGEISNAMWVE